MLRKLTLSMMALAIGTLSACHDGHHPRYGGPGSHGDHDHGGYHDDHHWAPH